MRNLSSTVKGIIRDFGVSVKYLTAEAPTLDLDTGEKKEILTPRKIRRALILSETITEKFTYDLSYIAAGKNFIQGGFYAEGLRSIVVLKRDVASPNVEDQVEIDGVRYRIQSIFDNPNGAYGFNLVDIKNVG